MTHQVNGFECSTEVDTTPGNWLGTWKFTLGVHFRLGINRLYCFPVL
jgi:hypothetical protein